MSYYSDPKKKKKKKIQREAAPEGLEREEGGKAGNSGSSTSATPLRQNKEDSCSFYIYVLFLNASHCKETEY